MCYCRLIGIVASKQIGSECHLAAELPTSSRPLQSFVKNVNYALQSTLTTAAHYSREKALTKETEGHSR